MKFSTLGSEGDLSSIYFNHPSEYSGNGKFELGLTWIWIPTPALISSWMSTSLRLGVLISNQDCRNRYFLNNSTNIHINYSLFMESILYFAFIIIYNLFICSLYYLSPVLKWKLHEVRNHLCLFHHYIPHVEHNPGTQDCQ